MRIPLGSMLAAAGLVLIGTLGAADREPAREVAAGFPAQGIPRTPIEHLIVILGENRSFDHLFGVYIPPSGASVRNLWSQGIVLADGSPGPNFAKAAQAEPQDWLASYRMDIARTEPYAELPPPGCAERSPKPNARLPDRLPNGPYQISRYVPYGDRSGNPVHRFFQMWQQTNAGRMNLFSWVSATAGEGTENGGDGSPPDCWDTLTPMGFYNMAAGDAPLLKALADRFALADNYHQSVMGGSGANFVALVTGDAAWFADRDGNPTAPPEPIRLTADESKIQTRQIENPDPSPEALPENPNRYRADGYLGGSYVDCSDTAAPGVAAIADWLRRHGRATGCEPRRRYLVNNRDPGYAPDGNQEDPTANPLALPPHPRAVPTIAEALARAGVSFAYYSGGRGDGTAPDGDYCGLCDPLTYFTRVMEDPSLRSQLRDLSQLWRDLDSGNLPAVAFVRPPESESGHPGTGSLPAFERLVARIVSRIWGDSELWSRSAILIAMDEGGGYYDSGPIEPIDFFGDGPRVPLIAVSPYARPGHIDHSYSEHASILKLIERNWGLPPLSHRSRDRLPNPISGPDPYAPANGPAVGDLMGLFEFPGEDRSRLVDSGIAR